MTRIFIFFMMILPVECFAQFSISGKVINKADSKPVANTSVFLSNATIGTKTDDKGSFVLRNIKPGKYQLIVSIIGFSTYSQPIAIDNINIEMPDIALSPKSIVLKEVSITYKKDPDRDKYYEWFKDEFLGRSAFAAECTILNPEILNLDYDKTLKSLTASTGDFLVIENNALGYRIEYLLQNFILTNKGDSTDKVHYEGPVLFEEMKGSRSAERRWIRNREETYENSPMHFLRAALNNSLTEEGFRVQKYALYKNLKRQPESLIRTKLAYYENLKNPDKYQRDSLAYWVKKSKLPLTFYKLSPLPLGREDIITPINKPGQYTLGADKNWLYVAYNKNQHFHISDRLKYLDYRNNTENTLIKFNETQAVFNSSGTISNPYSVIYYGVWGRNRVAEMLPVDYEPPKDAIDPDYKNSPGNIDSELEKYQSSYPTEKTYLHFDKPYYATGDTVYFKAYVTLGERHQLSALSSILHVDLINTSNKIDQSVKLQLIDGVGWGDFALPDSLPAGNYRIRAYTQWMRNEGNYFEQTMPVGSIHSQKIPENSTVHNVITNTTSDLQFFPEGGQLVAGIMTKIAFKAIGTNGLGINIKGTIKDQNGIEAGHFVSPRLGMGYFEFKPEDGKIYKASVTFNDGSQSITDLPKVEPQGIILSVNNDSITKAIITIRANPSYYNINKGKDYILLISSGGTITTVNCKLDSPEIKLDILKRRLHTGIARITLFSSVNEPLAERLIFVQNYDQLGLNIITDKNIYMPREKVSIRINAKTRTDSAATGHFSVAVTDENKVPVEENTQSTILADLLLTSDLKGTVEQPNYYFTNINDEKLKELDLVMLTHGYRRFKWKQVLSNDHPPIVWQPERSLQISGRAKSLFGKPLAKAQVSLISFAPKSLTNTVADENGKFLFDNLDFNDSIKFVLQAVNAKGRNKTKLIYNADKPVSITLLPSHIDNINTTVPPSYLDNNEKQQEELKKLNFGKSKMLQEVEIKAKKSDAVKTSPRYGVPDKIITAKQIGYGGQLNIKLLSLFHRPGYHSKAYLIVVDGIEMPKDFNVDQINTGSIKTLEVFQNIMGPDYEGVLAFTTNFGQQPNDVILTGFLPIKVPGYYKAREFYAPKYESSITNTHPDLRSTIYWKPELLTDKEGHASFDFYNADGTGNYRVVIEGIDEKGNIGRQVYRYRVE